MSGRRRVARVLLAVALSAAWVGGASGAPEASARPRQLDLHELFGLELHEGPELPSIVWIEGGSAYLYREPGDDGDWTRVETRSGKRSVWLRAEDLMAPAVAGDSAAAENPEVLKVGAYEPSPDGRRALLQTQRQKRWRRSHTAVHWVYDRTKRSLHRLAGDDLPPQIHAHFSPDGAQIGFVSGGDLYVVDAAGGEPRALTHDGSATVRNGDPDWVYEEELEFKRAWWWSPDGRQIAYLRFDCSDVPEMQLVRYGEDEYPTVEGVGYPKAGAGNPRVGLRAVAVTGQAVSLLDASDPSAAVPGEKYLVNVQWAGQGDALACQILDRTQQRLELRMWGVTPAPLFAESSLAWVETPSPLVFFDAGDRRGFLWLSDRGGFRHLYRFELGVTPPRQLTSGSWEVTELYGVDPTTRMALVQTTRGGPLTRELALVPLDGGEPRRVGDAGGWHSAEVAPDGRHFVETVSSSTQRPRMLLRRADGTLVRELASDPMEDLLGVDLGEARFVKVPIQDEAGERIELNGQLLLPPGFEPSRRYPAVIYCYGGPGSQVACDRWGGKRMLFHRRLAQDGIVVFLFDNRGTGGRGAAFMKQVYRKLGHFEVADQLAGARWLVEQGLADASRIAIWGWSYGGYTAGLTLLRSEGAIAAAACVAPVVDWRLYDSVYTERYMGMPDENRDGYEAASLLTYAQGLSGKLLLVHGVADDNVHAQHTLRLAAALQQAGKPFEMMLYPDKAHGMEGKPTQEHVYRLLRDFFHRALGIAPPADATTDAAAGAATKETP